jgi:hypothetical protein
LSQHVRRTAGLIATLTLTLAACGGDDGSNGTMPTPVEGGSETSTTPSEPASPPPSEPTTAPTKRPPGKAPLVYVVGGKFDSNPAVQGLKLKYPVFFRALVQRDPTIVATAFPQYFYADTVALIDEAKESGWTMRPPGSLVVRDVESRPNGIVRISSCRSQATQYWNPKRKQWVVRAPAGSPDVLDMVRRGSGWTMYRWVYPAPKRFSCAGVKYPA